MQMIHGTRSEEYPPETARTEPSQEEFKICPICGATCFADMDICFGCLHHFSEDEPNRTPSSQTPSVVTHPQPISLPSFDHTHDIASLQKPAEEALVVTHESCEVTKAEEGLTSHHVCSDKNGRQFEIAISIKML